ncbi:related to SSN8 - DNA-directed RNA polymerase II holoenzyme and SRB subcomplex subunit, cyclin C homolog [Moesziomyces antarcticus]|uniref:Related to SSN8 - DNA-directed RNA polymerase II holoenzyme and SRB subcomplex subunit, cyclin C homolog n=1 Tax=Pseudozyma antarctica TaxID=84753 RepID=A0A5C3FYN0_PSEA2|nr:related to SSN8 - DNA-directed RNA polymerase II holoenzyme and SRB subcomplex subunit, cyclin C homolog [Moesziomyces antarcticus]
MSANYWASTQCNNWLIDRAQLELARHEDREYASETECAAIAIFFANPIVCKRLNLRQRVVASACVFFSRFFCKNSYSAVEPFLVCATCVYVAAKVEESPIHIKSAVAEAARSFQEVGFRAMPTDNSSLAEMEFYLLEEMEFDMILFHPYRSLLALYDAHGSDTNAAAAGLGIEAEAFGVRGLEAIETTSEARLAELDQHVLQMSWLVLNDAYRSNIPLLYPPYMIALAAVWIALTLHTPAYERINATLESMQHHRKHQQAALDAIVTDAAKTPADVAKMEQIVPPSGEALTFFASLNVSLPLLAEVVQSLLEAYQRQSHAAKLVADGPGMVKLLERMRHARRTALVTANAHRR